MKKIYVVVINHGTEGRSAPLQAFHMAPDAHAAVALARAGMVSGEMEVFEVPIWPERVEGSYWDAKRVFPQTP